MLRCPMLVLWHDHPLIEAWLESEARQLRPDRSGQHAPSSENCPLQGFEVPMVEALPGITREAIERGSIHPLDQPAPAFDDNRRRR